MLLGNLCLPQQCRHTCSGGPAPAGTSGTGTQGMQSSQGRVLLNDAPANLHSTGSAHGLAILDGAAGLQPIVACHGNHRLTRLQSLRAMSRSIGSLKTSGHTRCHSWLPNQSSGCLMASASRLPEGIGGFTEGSVQVGCSNGLQEGHAA